MTAQARRSADRDDPTSAATDSSIRPVPAADTMESLLMAEMEAALIGDVSGEPPRIPAPPKASPAAPPSARLWPESDAPPVASATPAAPRREATTGAAAVKAGQAAPPADVPPPAAAVAADRLRADRGPPLAEPQEDRPPAAAPTIVVESAMASEDRWSAERSRRRRPEVAARGNGRRLALAAGSVLLAVGVAGALYLAIPDSDPPATEASAGTTTDGGPTAAGAAGDAAGARVVEAPRTGGERVEVAAPQEENAAPPAATAEPAATPAGDTPAVAARTDAVASQGTPPSPQPATGISAGAAPADPEAEALRQALAAAAERARLAEAPGAATSAGEQTIDGAPATGAPILIDPAAAPPAAGGGETLAATAGGSVSTDELPVDPGGFGVMPLPDPRESTAEVASTPAADGPVRVAEAAADGDAAAAATVDAPRADEPVAAPPLDPAPSVAAPVETAAAGSMTASRTVRVGTAVNLRSGPTNDAATVSVIPAGSEVAVGACDYWCEVEFGGNRGWVYKSFVGAP